MGLALALANIGGAPAAAAFDPTKIASLRMWLDPTSGVVGTNPVTAWADKQGNVSTFTNVGTDVKKGTSLNTRASIDINTVGGGTRLSAASALSTFLSASAWWAAYVWKYTGNASQGIQTYTNPLIIGSIGTYWQALTFLLPPRMQITQFDGAYKTDVVTASGGAVHYAIQRYDGSVLQTSIDGGAFDAGTSAGNIGLISDNPIAIGNTTQPGATDFIGSVGDILGGNAKISDADATSLNAYLKARYGL